MKREIMKREIMANKQTLVDRGILKNIHESVFEVARDFYYIDTTHYSYSELVDRLVAMEESNKFK